MIISNTKNYLKNVFNQFINLSTIRKADKKLEIEKTKDTYKNILNNDLKLKQMDENGFVNIPNSFPQNLSQICRNNYLQKKSLFSRDMLELFKFFNENYFGLVQNYLGENACLINYGYQVLDSNQNVVSGNWHTDNLGNKMNFFLVIEGHENIPTHIIPSSHKKKYFPDILQNLRFISNFKNQKKKFNTEMIKHKTGDINIFDGNSIHRGDYETFSQNKKRIHISLEFVNIDKIKNLGFVNHPKFFFIKSFKPPFRKQNCNKNKYISEDLLNEYLKFPFIKKEFIQTENNHNYYNL
tara:strand:+ start:2512 stop:3399 length:888 start_codon:yes stop_codon:yes gene_type:complete